MHWDWPYYLRSLNRRSIQSSCARQVWPPLTCAARVPPVHHHSLSTLVRDAPSSSHRAAAAKPLPKLPLSLKRPNLSPSPPLPTRGWALDLLIKTTTRLPPFHESTSKPSGQEEVGLGGRRAPATPPRAPVGEAVRAEATCAAPLTLRARAEDWGGRGDGEGNREKEARCSNPKLATACKQRPCHATLPIRKRP
jgi:hypothetical protein